MGCFTAYYYRVSEKEWSIADNLDAAVDLCGCVGKSLRGSGPLYHLIESAKAFTESEKKTALELAKRAKDLNLAKDGGAEQKETIFLIDDLHDFAIGCLVARGAVHKGAPKIPIR